MLTKAFAVFDSKAGYFQVPFFSPTVGTGLRLFESLCRDSQSMVSKYPSDFSLFLVGEYNDQSGELIPCIPVSVGTAVSVLGDSTNA